VRVEVEYANFASHGGERRGNLRGGAPKLGVAVDEQMTLRPGKWCGSRLTRAAQATPAIPTAGSSASASAWAKAPDR
jgi:hypothetical protein